MKTITPRPLRLLAAVFGLIAVSASAQITTFITYPAYSGSDISGGSGKAFTQTFTHVLGVQEMTYRFVRSSNSAATNVSWYFAEWDTTTNRATALLASNSFSVPSGNSFTTYQYTDPVDGPIDYLGYDLTINLNATSLNATKTYAMILLNPSTQLKLQLIDSANIPTANQFQWGAAYNATGISNFGDLTTTTSSPYAPPGTDWGFAQIVVDLAPVPEPATAAAGLGAVLIAGLVGFRMLQRRRALATATAAA